MSNASEQNRRMRAGFNDSRRAIFEHQQAEKKARAAAAAERQRRASLPAGGCETGETNSTAWIFC